MSERSEKFRDFVMSKPVNMTTHDLNAYAICFLLTELDYISTFNSLNLSQENLPTYFYGLRALKKRLRPLLKKNPELQDEIGKLFNNAAENITKNPEKALLLLDHLHETLIDLIHDNGLYLQIERIVIGGTVKPFPEVEDEETGIV